MSSVLLRQAELINEQCDVTPDGTHEMSSVMQRQTELINEQCDAAPDGTRANRLRNYCHNTLTQLSLVVT